MFSVDSAIVLFCVKCSRVVADASQAITSKELSDAFVILCELEGMAQLLAWANDVAMVYDAYPSLERRYNEAWAAWHIANARINCDMRKENRQTIVQPL